MRAHDCAIIRHKHTRMGQRLYQRFESRCRLIGGGNVSDAVGVEHAAGGEDDEPGGDLRK